MKTRSSESKKNARGSSVSSRVRSDSQGASNMDGGKFTQTFTVKDGVSGITNTFGR